MRTQLGAIRFGSDTGTWWRKNVLAPFLAHYLKDDAPSDADVAPVTVYETGENRWQKLDAWPVAPKMTPLYLEAGFKASFEPGTQLAPLSTSTFRILRIRCRFGRGLRSRWGTCCR